MFIKIIKLGWKNVWRNPTRSGVVVIAVLLGTWAGISLSGFFTGMMRGYLDHQLGLTVAHIEITHPKFEDFYSPQYYIPDADSLAKNMQKEPLVTEVSSQSMATGLAQSTRNSYGVTLHGINPDSSHPIMNYIVNGSPLNDSNKRNPIIIGRKLAERLDIDIGSRIVLSFQELDGNITGGAFQVAGMFDTFSDPYDQSNVFLDHKTLNNLLGLQNQVHRIRLTLSNFEQAPQLTEKLQSQYPNLKVTAWGDAAPELEYVYDMTDLMMYIVMIIVVIALVFSIINTMLMAVLERTRELGMLRAVGMNKPRVFAMIVWETLFLTMVGTPIGLALSWLTINYFGDTGIHLGAFAEGLSAYGLGTVIYPTLPTEYYINITIIIALAALLSALYPAWRALQLKPIEAIRKFN